MGRRLWLALFLVFAMVAAGCGDDGDDGGDEGSGEGSGGGGSEETLLMGFAADFSELGGYADQPAAEAMQFEVDRINEQGDLGVELELVVENIDGDATTTRRAAQELIDQGVSVIFGPPFSDFGNPLLNVTRGEVPVLFIASTEAVLADAEGKAAFLMAFSDPVQATAAAEFARGQEFETAITLSSPDAPYFQQNPAIFTEVFEREGGTVDQDLTFSLADEDFSSQVNAIASAQPDVVYTAIANPQLNTFLQQLREAAPDVAVIGADAFDATSVATAGEAAEGVFYTTHTFPGEGNTADEWLAEFEAETGAELQTQTFGILGADAVQLVAEAYRQAGSTDPQAIYEALLQLEDVEAISETYTFAGTNGVPDKPVYIVTIEGGEPAFVTTITPEDVPEG